MSPKLSGFLIAIVLISCFASVYGIVIVTLGNNYNIETSSLNLSKYQKLDESYAKVKQAQGNITNIKQSNSVVDIVGSFFYNGYKVLVSIPETFDLYQEMTEAGLKDSGLGTGGDIIKDTLLAILLITLFVGIILAVILNRIDL